MITDTLHSHVLQLDIQGTPQAWISLEQAATHVATDSVAWVDGDGPLATLRGGINVKSGAQSVIDIYPIMALRGASQVNLYERLPGYTRARLFRRDRHTCAYCGELLADRWLTCDHIVPQCQGGGWDWMNLVTACRSCNSRKARSNTGTGAHATAVPAVRAQPPRELPARRAAHSGRRA